MGEKLEKTLETKQPRLRFYVMSELELGTKLNDPDIMASIGELIKNDNKRIDGILINGLMAYVPDRYSRWRGERLDLMEDHLLERYGQDTYDKVKKGKNDSDSVDDLVEATRLGAITMDPITQQAKKKNIEIHCVAGDTDYRNKRMLIESLEKLSKRNNYNGNKNNSKKRGKNPNVRPDEVERVLAFIPDGYKFKTSKWKNSDKGGIKNKANEIYHNIINNIFKGAKVHVYKRFENYAGDSTVETRPEDITINGMKIKAFYSINGLTAGLNEGKPSERNIQMIIDYASKDALDGRLGDIYITGNGSSTDFTSIDYRSRKDPVFIFNQGPILDIDKQFRLRASFNKTSVSKRLSQFEDSAISIFTVNDDGSVEIEHIDATGLKKRINPSKLEKELSKGSMYEVTKIADLHIGNAKSDYEAIESIPAIVARIRVPLEYRKLFDGGDAVDGGIDKAQRTKMSLPTAPTPEDLQEELNNIEKITDYGQRIKKMETMLYESVFGHSDLDIGRQLKRLNTYIKPLAPLFSTVYLVNGNHMEKATGNGSESDAKGSKYKDNGTKEVVYADALLENDMNPTLGPYVLYLTHSPGYRGGLDARTGLMNVVKNTAQDTVDIAMAGDCHEAGIKFAFKRKYTKGLEDGEWRTLVTTTIPSLEKQTGFEKNIIHKHPYTKGISQLYLPADESIGTSYIKYRFIPSQTIHADINAAGGSSFYRSMDRILKK